MTETAPALKPRHALMALAVVAVWGTNFSIIRIALDALPPFTLAVLRFTLAFVPLAFFLPRPKVAMGNLAAYGLLIGAGQFGLLFFAMTKYLSPGLASLVLQTQVFFTIGLAAVLEGERVKPVQLVALALAATGLVLIAVNTDGHTTPLGVALGLAGALSWASGNLVGRRARGVNVLHYVVWSSLFAVPPLLALAWFVDGPAAIATGLQRATWGTWAAVLWQTLGNTLFGYGVWGWLLARYPAATVSPWALGVPVFGMVTAALWLGEPLPAWKIGAAALVISGLGLNLVASRAR